MRSDNLRPAPRWITPKMVKGILQLAMPAPGETAPVKTYPVRGEKPKLAIVPASSGPDDHDDYPGEVNDRVPNPPVTHSRRTEEDEAVACPAASPRRHGNPKPSNQAELAKGRSAYCAQRHAEAWAQIECERPLYQIAFDRGIAVADLARALGQKLGTVYVHTRQAGFDFGRRPRLADPLTIEQLRLLADPAAPLPESARDRGARESNERRNRLKRERRAALAQASPKPIREVTKAAPRRPAVPSPSREPAVPAAQQPPAHPVRDRRQIDRAQRKHSDAVRRGHLKRAGELLDAGIKPTNVHEKLAMREVENLRAQEYRMTDPVEQAKTVLRRRFAPVCSMAVYEGDPDRFMVGSRKDVTRDELLAMAARIAA